MERKNPPQSTGSVKTYTKEQMLAYTSELVQRASLAARLGYQYGGDRDIYEALGYPDTISYDDYAARYGRQDIARAVINRPVHFTWKGPLSLTETGEMEESKLVKEWGKLEEELRLKNKFIRLDKLSSIGNYGVLLLGFDDVRNGKDWERPVKSGKRTLHYVKPLGEGHAKIATYIKDPGNPRYGLVEKYNIELKNPGSDETTALIAHHSRVLHVAPELIESEVEGEPVLRSVWNRLLDLEKLVGGSAEMFWRGARPGYQGLTKDDFEVPDTTAWNEKLQNQFDEMEHNLRRVMTLEGMELKDLAPQVSDPSNHVDVVIQMISSVTGIPKRILTGSERGELSSDQDIVGWYNVVQTRREEHAEINIIRPFVNKMIEHKVLPPPSTGKYQIKWEDLFTVGEKEQAEVGRARAMAIREYSQNPTAEMIIPREAFMEIMLGLSADQIKRIQTMSSSAIDEELNSIVPIEEGKEK